MSHSRESFEPRVEGSTLQVGRLELVVLLALLLVGFTLRAWRVSSVGLDHFDEGVYVFSALGLADTSQPHRLYPEQVKFSPPLYFSLVGLSYYLLGGPSDTPAIWINVLLGTLTIGALWWVGRTWFDPATGLAAAALLALSEYHIVLSRTALTDVSFALVFLLALAAVSAAFERRSALLAVLAGLAIGLAWNTKYHGWFALLVAGGAVLAVATSSGWRGNSLRRNLILWGVMAVVAAVAYLPWASLIQSEPGGYLELAKYQRTLLSRNWFPNFWHQVKQQFFLEGPFTRASIPLALLCVSLIAGRGVRSTTTFVLLLTLLVLSSTVLGGSGTAVLLSLASIPILLKRRTTFQAWLLLGWLGLWVVSTPVYKPYARLLLPFNIATYLAGGLWISSFVGKLQERTRAFPWRAIFASLATVGVASLGVLMPDPSLPWRSSRSAAEAAESFEKYIPEGSRVIVIGEPTLAFYLHLANRPAYERIEDPAILEEFTTPVFVVTGLYAKRAPSIREGLQRLEDRLVPLDSFAMYPKDVRLLDDLDPLRATKYLSRPDSTFELTLYRLLPDSKTQ